MDTFSDALIDQLGGTARVAQMMTAAPTTVSNMRKRLTGSRLNHLVRIASDEGKTADVQQLAAEHGVRLPDIEPLNIIGSDHDGGLSDDIQTGATGKIDYSTAEAAR